MKTSLFHTAKWIQCQHTKEASDQLGSMVGNEPFQGLHKNLWFTMYLELPDTVVTDGRSVSIDVLIDVCTSGDEV